MGGGKALRCLPFFLLPEAPATERLSQGSALSKVREQEILCGGEHWWWWWWQETAIASQIEGSLPSGVQNTKKAMLVILLENLTH